MISIEGIHECTVVGITTQFAAKLSSSESLFITPTAATNHYSLCFRRSLGGDIDDAVDSICAPDGRTRAANDFDAVDDFQRNLLHIPKDPAEKRGIHCTSID